MPEEKSPRPHASNPSPAAKAADAEVLSLLSDFENSVDALKKLCATKPRAGAASVPGALDRAQTEKRAAELRASLEKQTLELKRRAAELDQQAQEIERARREFAAEVERQKSSVVEQLSQGKVEQNNLSQREESLVARLASAEAIRSNVESKLRELERRESAFEEKLNSGVLDTRIVELNSRLVDAQALAEHKSSELCEHRRRLEAAEGQIAALASQLQAAQSTPMANAVPASQDPEIVRAREKLEELLVATRKDLDAAQQEAAEHKLRAEHAEVALDDVRRQSTRITDTTRELHDENDLLKRELEAIRQSLEESKTQAEITSSQHVEFLRRQETSAATIAQLEKRLEGLLELEPLKASIREEIEQEFQAPFARAAERANMAETAAAAANAELAALRARSASETAHMAALQVQFADLTQTLNQRDEQLSAQTSKHQLAVLGQAQLEQELREEQDKSRTAEQKLATLESQHLELLQRTSSLERALNESREIAQRNESLAQRTEAELAAAQRRVTQLEGSAQELRSQFDFAGSRGEADSLTIASLESELAAARERLESAQQQHNVAVAQIDEIRARFETERVSLQSALGDASAEHEQAVIELNAMSNAVSEKNEQLAIMEMQLAAANSLASQVDNLRQENTRLTGSLVESTNVANSAAARIQELELSIVAAESQLAEMQERLSQVPAGDSDVGAMKGKLELLKDRLRTEIAAHDADLERIAELERQIANRPIAQPVSGVVVSTGRIERLRLHRRLRREQTSKLRNLGDSLRSRFEICEQLIGQRAQLAVAQQMVNEAQRKVQAKQAGSRVGVVAFFAAMTVLILACLSWAAAGQLFPGRYASRVTIQADGRGRDLPMEELQEWQRFHEDMLTSPGFSEKIADHMRKFGIMNLATPTAVNQRMKEDLSSESPTPGELVIELRGDGAARTTRELNALATRFASEAQELRTRRNDGAITTITKPAAALPEPIDNSRLIGAAGILGGTVSLAALISMLLYRKLVSTKSKFETDIALAGMLDASKWPDPTLGLEKSKKAA